MKPFFDGLLAVTVCVLSMACVAAPQTLTVGYYNFPPAIYSDAQGQAQGPLVDLTQRVLQHAGYDVRFHGMPSGRLYAALRSGSIDLWLGAPGKPELMNDTLEGRETLSLISLNLYHRPDTDAPKVPEGLAKRDVIVITGYNYWPAVNEILQNPRLAIRLHRTSSHTSALGMLQRRRADFLLDYQIPVSQAQQQLGMQPLPYVGIYKVPIRFIVSRQLTDNQQILDALDNAYAEMVAAGADFGLPVE